MDISLILEISISSNYQPNRSIKNIPMMIKMMPEIFGHLGGPFRRNHPKKVMPPKVNEVQMRYADVNSTFESKKR
jgi:hypothetical protein